MYVSMIRLNMRDLYSEIDFEERVNNEIKIIKEGADIIDIKYQITRDHENNEIHYAMILYGKAK